MVALRDDYTHGRRGASLLQVHLSVRARQKTYRTQFDYAWCACRKGHYMAQQYTSKIYSLAGVFGGVAVGGAYFLGSGLAAVTGIPLMPAVVNGLWVGLMMSAASYLLREYKLVGTAMMFVYGVAATFTILLGPPGWHKIPIAIAMGFIWDICLWKSKGALAYSLASTGFMAIGFALLMLAFHLQQSPAFDKMLAVLPVVVAVSVITMIIGSMIGRYAVGVRLDHLGVVKRVLGR